MLQRIIANEGVVVYAKNQEIYSIITCIDGLDYIIELVNNEKSWKLYNSPDNNDKINNHINISETDLPLLESQDNIEIQNEKKKGRKPKVVINNDVEVNVNEEVIIKPEVNVNENEIIIESQPIIKIIKKKGRPPKIKPIEIIESESSEEEIIIKKKIIKLKGKQNSIVEDEIDKKLSNYHTFISDFLSKNNDIVWNERMKAANESWKSSKSSKKILIR